MSEWLPANSNIPISWTTTTKLLFSIVGFSPLEIGQKHRFRFHVEMPLHQMRCLALQDVLVCCCTQHPSVVITKTTQLLYSINKNVGKYEIKMFSRYILLVELCVVKEIIELLIRDN